MNLQATIPGKARGRRTPIFLALLLGAAAALPAPAADALPVATEPDGSPETVMAAAAGAYDEGRFEEAARLYGMLIEKGYSFPALHFNLGNAWHRLGQTGPAVWQYRTAWRLAPRDPDIRANLRFVLERAGLSPPPSSTAALPAFSLSEREWILAALAAWWLAAIGGILYRYLQRPFLLRMALAALAAALVGAGALAFRRRADRTPEAVIVKPDVEALFAPLPEATAHFSLPEGSIVRVQEHTGAWRRIESDGRSGWIPAAAGRIVESRVLSPFAPRKDTRAF